MRRHPTARAEDPAAWMSTRMPVATGQSVRHRTESAVCGIEHTIVPRGPILRMGMHARRGGDHGARGIRPSSPRSGKRFLRPTGVDACARSHGLAARPVAWRRSRPPSRAAANLTYTLQRSTDSSHQRFLATERGGAIRVSESACRECRAPAACAQRTARTKKPACTRAETKEIDDLNSGTRTIMDRMRALLPRAARANALAQYADEEPPLRSELFSAEQLEQHGRNLAVAHRPAAGHAPRSAAAATGRERGDPAGSARPADGGSDGEPADRARGGMARRQLLPDRRADPHGEAASAQRLQPRTAAAGARTVRRAAARLRPRVRGDRARRRPDRRRRPVPLRRRVPDGGAARAGRAVGHSDHAAPRR